jgi:adenylate cyclase
MARLILINAPDRPAYEIVSPVFSIGRLPDNNLMLADALVSRRHSEIRKAGEHYRIVDLNSLNGVYVNNLKVMDEQLTHGDVIHIGESKLLFENSLAARKESTPPPAEEAPALRFGISGPGGLAGPEIVKPLSEAEPEYGLEALSLSSIGPGRDISHPRRLEPARSRNFFILYQVARALNSTNSLSELLDQTMTLIFQVINAERGVIFLYNEDGSLEPRISRNRKEGELPEIAVSKTITQRAVHEKAAIITADARYDPRFRSGDSIVAFNIRSAICVPLWTRGRIRGAIYLDNLMETYAFGEDDLDLLTAIANQVAIAVEHEEMQARMREAAVFRANLERFHSPEVANLIMQQSRLEDGFKKFLEEKEVTVIFADISKFTSLLEELRCGEAADLMNEYFEVMTAIVFKNNGTVDKFIGDAIMAIFGAPISRGNDTLSAVTTAVEMMKRMETFKAAKEKRRRFDIRIGINSGRVAAGYLGSQSRVDYSVLGDPVNVAARLQALAAPGTILVGEATYLAAQDHFSFKDRGTTRLKGKSAETRFFEVIY